MTKISNTVVNADLRGRVFEALFDEGVSSMAEMTFDKINDRQYGVLLIDLNGVERYVRIGAIVAEEREDMTARELMEKEIADYNNAQAKKAEKAKAAAEKRAKDEAKRKEATGA